MLGRSVLRSAENPRACGYPTEAQELLLQAALLDEDRARAAWGRWKRLETVVSTDQDSGRLFPLLSRRLLAMGADDPDLPRLKGAYRHQWVTNQRRLHRAGEALAHLADAGIETLVLKGAALAERRYGDAGLRLMYDVDVLVRAERAHEAASVLKRHGWRPLLPLDLDDLMPVIQGTLFKDEMEDGIDLHWHALWSPSDEDDFWSAAEPLEVGGAPTLCPCAADQLLHVCVHGVWSNGRPVRWVADAVTLLRSAPDLDWERVVDRARARSLTLPMLDALSYLSEAFDAPVPPGVLNALAGSRQGLRERLAHRAWGFRSTKLRAVVTQWDRYRRQRALPPGPTRVPSFAAYLRRWGSMTWGTRSDSELARAIVSRLIRPRRSGSTGEPRPGPLPAAASTRERSVPRPR
jgi:putative nucleotidyltransferase-like protein